MSAHLMKLVHINVTKGDCVDNNRKSGKSNTGTYFISSINNFDDYQFFFSEENKFKLDLIKVGIYKTMFSCYFIKYRNEYNGKMKEFNKYCNELISSVKYPTVNVTLRKNDDRVFMRFGDNSDSVVNAFRNILYEDLSLIAIEHIKSNLFYIYPVINEKRIKQDINNRSSLIEEED